MHQAIGTCRGIGNSHGMEPRGGASHYDRNAEVTVANVTRHEIVIRISQFHNKGKRYERSRRQRATERLVGAFLGGPVSPERQRDTRARADSCLLFFREDTLDEAPVKASKICIGIG